MDVTIQNNHQSTRQSASNAEPPDTVEEIDIRNKLLSDYQKGERNFCGKKLSHIDLSACTLDGSDFSDADFTGANLCGASLKNAKLIHTDLTGAKLSRATLQSADVSRAIFTNADLVGADLRHAIARAADFSNALMLRARFSDSDCLGAFMTAVNATAAQFETANLECTDLSHAVMMNANLNGANCAWANITDTRLNWAQMNWCNLEAADMELANLTGVSLRGANLSFSNLDQAILTGADLYFANLSGAKLPESLPVSMRIASSRITFQSFTRSNWTKEQLRDYQNRGAIILDFDAFPRDVLTFIRKGNCNLRIYFDTVVDNRTQIALETLIACLVNETQSLQILSVSTHDQKSQVAFRSSDPDNIDKLVTALREHTWHNKKNIIREKFDLSYASNDKSIDVFALLDHLSANIKHIQALVPVSKDDKTKQLQSKLEPYDKLDETTQISWSSVSLPKVSRS